MRESSKGYRVRSLIIVSYTSTAWLSVKFWAEELFLMGDWRWAIAVATFVILIIVTYAHGLRHRKVVFGYRRAWHIMQARIMKKVKALFDDYWIHEERRIVVCAVYSLRLWRHGTKDSAWKSIKIEGATLGGFSCEDFESAKRKLEEQFSERWWSKWMRHRRDLNEQKESHNLA